MRSSRLQWMPRFKRAGPSSASLCSRVPARSRRTVRHTRRRNSRRALRRRIRSRRTCSSTASRAAAWHCLARARAHVPPGAPVRPRRPSRMRSARSLLRAPRARLRRSPLPRRLWWQASPPSPRRRWRHSCRPSPTSELMARVRAAPGPARAALWERGLPSTSAGRSWPRSRRAGSIGWRSREMQVRRRAGLSPLWLRRGRCFLRPSARRARSAQAHRVTSTLLRSRRRSQDSCPMARTRRRSWHSAACTTMSRVTRGQRS
mmetsp:Transcript_13195/g.55238  ORF Transcript_13195/g.55238 Transcript_13195/m.55238 type:complete len:261 (+) Transcript_13195:1290-2072(+)